MNEASTQKKNLEYYLSLSYGVQLSLHREEDMDDYWIAEILDLPGCVSDGSTPDEAVENLEEAKYLWIETQIEDGLEVPEPTQTSGYSGKFLVRLPRTLHRRLAEQAKRENVSLNQCVVNMLSDANATARHIGDLRRSLEVLSKEVGLLRRMILAMQAQSIRPEAVPVHDFQALPTDYALGHGIMGNTVVARGLNLAMFGAISEQAGVLMDSSDAFYNANRTPPDQESVMDVGVMGAAGRYLMTHGHRFQEEQIIGEARSN